MASPTCRLCWSPHKPLDLVIIMLGTNDLKNHMGHDAHAIAQGVGVLVETVQASDAGPQKKPPQVLMICPAAVSDGHCPFDHLFDSAPELSRQLPAAYQEIAESRGVAFLDANAHASCPVPDAIHIDADGHAALGKAVAGKVRDLLG